MAVDLKHIETRLSKLEQEMWALRTEMALLQQSEQSTTSTIETLLRESSAITQRTQAVFQQMGIPDQPTMSLSELQTALGSTLPSDTLTQTVLQMREE